VGSLPALSALNKYNKTMTIFWKLNSRGNVSVTKKQFLAAYDHPKVTEEQFLAVYNKHDPNKWVLFVYRYFSKETKKTDKWLSRIIYSILVSLFILGFGGTIIKLGRTFIGTITFIFTGILVLLVGVTFPAFLMNNLRIRKIRKELNLTLNEYEFYANVYLR
jgi:hypothetical protein